MARTNDYSAASGAWGKHTWANSPYTNGSNVTYGSAGPRAVLAGRYWAQGWITWPASSGTGRRIIGVAEASQSAPSIPGTLVTVPGVTGLQQQVFGCPITLGANQQATLFTYQDSGGTLLVSAGQIGLTLYRLRR